MGMIVKIKELSRMSVLLLIAFSVIALSGCGKPGTPPPGATITIRQMNPDPIISSTTNTAEKTKKMDYRISVFDSSGNPLEGVSVDIIGQFDNGTNIGFGGLIGLGTAPIQLTSKKTTDSSGIITFSITVSYFNQGVKLDPPANQTANPSATGGFLQNGTTYSYTVTALDFQGETNAAPTISAFVSGPTTSSSGSVALSWLPVPGAIGYNLYGRIPGAESYMVTVLCNPTCPNPVTIPDTGQYNPNGTPPPTGNSTGVSLNVIKGSFYATAGSAISPATTMDF